MAKRLGRHPEKLLTAVQVKAVKEPGRYTDGNGLYLVVHETGAKRWLLRVVIGGRRRDMGLGNAGLVPLAEARDKAIAARKLARDGGDPIAERARQRQSAAPTFEAAAKAVYEANKASWANPKHAQQWINTLQTYAYPHIGKVTVDKIETPAILRVLSPIWLAKPETARRVRQRLGTVMDWAKAAGFRRGDNPVEGVARGLPKQTDRDVHHAALAFGEVAGFIVRLRESDSLVSALAFEFLILTATRTSEALNATWAEVDTAQSIWTIPATRMKAGVEHRVPLSMRALAILEEVKKHSPESEFVFPSSNPKKPFSNGVFLMMLRRMKVQVTAHGFRSAFSDWAAETTAFPREIVEMALAHTIKNKVEAAYRRGDLLDKRRELMHAWASYVNGEA